MIKRLYINNFKSLVDFEIEFSQFNCLIGLNGAGKSTLVQALDFISILMIGNVGLELAKRGWNSTDLISKLNSDLLIEFELDFETALGSYRWKASFDRHTLQCIEEFITDISSEATKSGAPLVLLSVSSGEFSLFEDAPSSIVFDYQGSLLAHLKGNVLEKTRAENDRELPAIKSRLISISAFNSFSPEALKQPSSLNSSLSLSHDGHGLSRVLYDMTQTQKNDLTKEIQKFYKQFNKFSIAENNRGDLSLLITEALKELTFSTSSHHINDGMLRTIAVLSELCSEHQIVLFDEIENGINPEIIERLVDTLIASDKQVFVTTHSPMILNYIEDSIARNSVILLYKNDQGATQATRLFDVPSASEKLEVLAPGDAMLDLHLAEVAKEAQALKASRV